MGRSCSYRSSARRATGSRTSGELRPGTIHPRLAPVIALFTAAIFVSAALVFLVQPMTAKLLLPTFGGSPQVWTAAMVFFQGALLAGYGWAHLSTRTFGRRQPLVHVALLLVPLLVLPIAMRGLETAGTLPPALAVVAILAVSVGAPYVAVSATSPLLQRWFSATGHRSARDPYFLYAAGNVGSLLGLLGYPILIEPRLPVGGQGILWSAGYVVFASLCIACAVALVRRGPADTGATIETVPVAPVPGRRRLGWLLRAFVPASLMLGVTTYSATDVAAVPLLWAIPLSIYLLSFVLAFSSRQLVSARTWALLLPPAVVLVVLTILGVVTLPIWARLAIHYAAFFVATMVAHTQLADDRPEPAHLTGFYLILALGGVLGGLFNAIVAPAIFDAVLEYPLVIVLALLLRPARTQPNDALERDPRAERRARLLDLLVPLLVYLAVLVGAVVLARLNPDAGRLTAWLVGAAVVVSLLLMARPIRFALTTGSLLAVIFFAGQGALFADRTFFGLSRVIDDGEGRHVYLSGSTIHGVERWEPGGSRVPISYYHPSGPAGQIFGSLSDGRTAGPGSGAGDELEVAIVGLGAGGLAAYGERGQHYTFVEIDPVVIEIAKNPDLFRFVAESEARIDIHEADGRLWLEDAPEASFDLIVLDAFSSDAIPAHIVTREAVSEYVSKLRPGGRLLFNVTNSYIDVRAVVAGALDAAGVAGYFRHDTDVDAAPPGDKQVSEWIVAAPDPATLRDVAADPRWVSLDTLDRHVLWTDDFSDILSVLK
jgi:SAM-dependent methyltransferase